MVRIFNISFIAPRVSKCLEFGKAMKGKWNKNRFIALSNKIRKYTLDAH